MVSHIYICFWFLVVYGILPYLEDTHMPVYKRYVIQYSTIVPYYVKVDHNLTFINSMTLIDTNEDKEERRTKVSVCCYW